MAISDKLNYLIETKSQLKDMINYGLDDDNKITSSTTFRNYVGSVFKAFLESLNNPDTLFTNLPKITNTGSNITLNDTANAPMRIMLNATDITQDGTPTPDSPQDIHTISGDNKVVVCGKNLFDGKSITQSTYVYPCKIGDTFTLSFTGYTTAGDKRIFLRTTDEAFTTTINSKTDESVVTITETSASYSLTVTSTINGYVYIRCGGAYNFYVLSNIQVEKGSTATTYTPYISQEADIDLSSKNKLSPVIENSIVVNAGTVAEYRIDGSYSVVSTGQNSSPVSSRKDLLDIYTIKNGDYLHIVNDTIPTSGTVQIVGFDSSNTQIFAVSINSIKKIQDLSSYAGKTISKIQFYITANCVCNINLTPMILNTNTTANFIKYYNYGEYSKMPNTNYKDQFIRTSGKNLFDKSKVVGGWISKTDRVYNQSTDTYNYIDYIKVKPNTTYTLNLYDKTGLSSGAVLEYNDNKELIQEGILETEQVITFTTTSTTKYVRFTTRVDSNNYVQFEEGNTATTYEPYGSNKWYINKNIGKYVANGDLTGNGTSDTTVSLITPALNISASLGGTALANISKNNLLSGYSSTGVNTLNGTTGTKCIRVVLSKDYCSDYATANTFLKDNNFTICYGMEKPEYIPITGTLAEQLENVYQLLKSYKGVTNISQVNNDLPFELDVEAVEDIE